MSKLNELKKITQKLSLLYVEDNEDLRDTTMKIFSSLFNTTVAVEDGQVGLNSYNEYFRDNGKYFDIVITDIEMPNMNGIEMTREILTINKEQKILVISAYDDKKYLIELINIGITGFIQKPLNLEQISSVLYDLCSKFAEEQEIFRILKFEDDFKWDNKHQDLSHGEFKVMLSDDETKLFALLADNLNKKFTKSEIFEHLYGPDKKFSEDEIENIIESLQEQIPKSIIKVDSEFRYCINS